MPDFIYGFSSFVPFVINIFFFSSFPGFPLHKLFFSNFSLNFKRSNFSYAFCLSILNYFQSMQGKQNKSISNMRVNWNRVKQEMLRTVAGGRGARGARDAIIKLLTHRRTFLLMIFENLILKPSVDWQRSFKFKER